jgi:hypothetical protein
MNTDIDHSVAPDAGFVTDMQAKAAAADAAQVALVPPVTAQASSRYIINAVNGALNMGAVDVLQLVVNLKTMTSITVGNGIIVTLFQEAATPPEPSWWPVFWSPWGSWFTLVYYVQVPNKPIPQPRTFLAAGTYGNLNDYIAEYSNRVVALRVDRVSRMTALRKAAIMKRLRDDLNAVQKLLDDTPGALMQKARDTHGQRASVCCCNV